MAKRMACSLTIDQVRDRTKTVTRRHVDTWRTLVVGDRLTLIEKGMGLKAGEHQVELADVEIVAVSIQPLHLVDGPGELAAEGFPNMSPAEFVTMWCASHGYAGLKPITAKLYVPCRRIGFRYL